MQVLGLIKLDAYKRSHANARGALDAWQLEVERSHWSGPQDVKNRYPSASFFERQQSHFQHQRKQLPIGRQGQI